MTRRNRRQDAEAVAARAEFLAGQRQEKAEIGASPDLDVLLIPVGGVPIRARVKRHFRAFQHAIGDRSYTSVPAGPGVDIICADDIHGIEDKPKGCGLYGDYLFVGSCDEEGYEQSLTEEQFRKAEKYWAAKAGTAPPSADVVKGSFRVMASGSLEHLALQERQRQAARDALAFWNAL